MPARVDLARALATMPWSRNTAPAPLLASPTERGTFGNTLTAVTASEVNRHRPALHSARRERVSYVQLRYPRSSRSSLGYAYDRAPVVAHHAAAFPRHRRRGRHSDETATNTITLRDNAAPGLDHGHSNPIFSKAEFDGKPVSLLVHGKLANSPSYSSSIAARTRETLISTRCSARLPSDSLHRFGAGRAHLQQRLPSALRGEQRAWRLTCALERPGGTGNGQRRNARCVRRPRHQPYLPRALGRPPCVRNGALRWAPRRALSFAR